jgi:hypothetical protein
LFLDKTTSLFPGKKNAVKTCRRLNKKELKVALKTACFSVYEVYIMQEDAKI